MYVSSMAMIQGGVKGGGYGEKDLFGAESSGDGSVTGVKRDFHYAWMGGVGVGVISRVVEVVGLGNLVDHGGEMNAALGKKSSEVSGKGLRSLWDAEVVGTTVGGLRVEVQVGESAAGGDVVKYVESRDMAGVNTEKIISEKVSFLDDRLAVGEINLDKPEEGSRIQNQGVRTMLGFGELGKATVESLDCGVLNQGPIGKLRFLRRPNCFFKRGDFFGNSGLVLNPVVPL